MQVIHVQQQNINLLFIVTAINRFTPNKSGLICIDSSDSVARMTTRFNIFRIVGLIADRMAVDSNVL
jgi:hypothetical protein